MADQIHVNYIVKDGSRPAASVWVAEMDSGPFKHDVRIVTGSSFADVLTNLGTMYTTLAGEVNT